LTLSVPRLFKTSYVMAFPSFAPIFTRIHGAFKNSAPGRRLFRRPSVNRDFSQYPRARAAAPRKTPRPKTPPTQSFARYSFLERTRYAQLLCGYNSAEHTKPFRGGARRASQNFCDFPERKT
jgi:hypothetical protein